MRHRMSYVASGSENIPFPDEHFSVVATINSLDHVDDFGKTASEMQRVTAPGGSVLISVEIDHPPRDREPLVLSEDGILRSLDVSRSHTRKSISSDQRVGQTTCAN
jgi:ubiquinone/menaquinone biosynthesis C-methylase UbiE